uniref:VTT domain-containing protein n=1 Tax=Zea mays TaxID=4577 RepID=A0A804N9T6_MAIZE
MRQLHLSPQLSPSPVLSSHFSPPPAEALSWRRRLHRGRAFQPPLSSLRDPNKATLRKASSNVPFRLGGGGSGSPKDRRPADDDKEEEEAEGEGGAGALTGTLVAGALLVGFVGGFGAAGYVYKDQINTFLTQFSGFIDGYGPAGYALFVLVYAGLEVLAIPAIPLTMSAGLLFGSVTGTIIVSISGTLAAAVAFLIARYFARERILKLVEGNKKFLAIDKAIGENGFKVVTLLRLSPLLPFSLGNYLYGLTSVKFLPYVLGRFMGLRQRWCIRASYNSRGVGNWLGRKWTAMDIECWVIVYGHGCRLCNKARKGCCKGDR